MASGTVVVIPSNGANMIQTVPGFPTVALQAPGETPYPMYGAQQLGMSTSAPQQVPQKGPWERFLKAEPKVLGAVQILIGLIHIGFGAISLCLLSFQFFPLSAIGGYPFWGGIFFISSGSLCVAAASSPNPSLVKSSVGMNITSAIMALTGIMLFICELIIRNAPPSSTSVIIIFCLTGYIYLWHELSSSSHRLVVLGLLVPNIFSYVFLFYLKFNLRGAQTEGGMKDTVQKISYGFSSVLLLFSMLEFCIAVSLAHFGCQAACCGDDQPTMVFVPYQVIEGGEVAAEPNPPPPPPAFYNNMVTTSQ